MPVRHLLAAAAGLALADASVVVLALPSILSELDTTVEGAAAVIGVYTLALAVALPAGEALRRRTGARVAGSAALMAFAVASLLCGLASSLELLVALRALQALGAGVALVAIFDLLGAGEEGGPGRRAWSAAAVLGIAVGPALGGTLTEVFDWRAIFLLQAPVAAIAAAAAVTAGGGARRDGAAATAGGDTRRPGTPGGAGADADAGGEGFPLGPAVALGLVSAALTGVLFLLVLQLVTGWSLEPLSAAAVVTVLPLAALAGARIPGPPAARAAAGCALVGAGVLTLAFLPGDEVAWTVAPQVLAGVGMGLAIPALAGGLLPERTPAEAARLLAARHLGITLALVVIAPITAAQVDGAVERLRERGAALVLDAPLPPLEKIELAGVAATDLDPVDPRDALRRALAENAGRFEDPAERAAYAELSRRADETLVAGIDDAFRPAYLVCGALALLAALAVRPPPRGRSGRLALAVGVAALALPAAQALLRPGLAPEPVVIADPCAPRELPATGGLQGVVQDAALRALDSAACRFGSSREALALALADQDAARAYERRYGVDPREAGGLLGGILGF